MFVVCPVCRLTSLPPPPPKVRRLRDELKVSRKEYDRSEDDLKALQSVGQIIGEVLRQLDAERCALKGEKVGEGEGNRRPSDPVAQGGQFPLSRGPCPASHGSYDRDLPPSRPRGGLGAAICRGWALRRGAGADTCSPASLSLPPPLPPPPQPALLDPASHARRRPSLHPPPDAPAGPAAPSPGPAPPALLKYDS